MKKRKLKLITKILLIFIIIFCLTTSLFLLYLYCNKNNELVYAYNLDQNINYSVDLFDNNFIDNADSNNVYISELVKKININYNFDYSATKDAKLKFKYKIIGMINSTYTGSNENNQGSIWSKEYILLDEITKETDSKNVFVNQDLVLDFQKYKEEVESFKKNFGVSISTEMKIKFIVNIIGTVNGKEFNKEEIMNLSFPLGVKAFSITEDYNKNINDKIVTKVDSNQFSFVNIPTILSLLIISISLFIIFYKKIFKFEEKNNYMKQINKILKKYGNIIIEITTPININDYEIIEVKNIEEMVDLEEELRIPINFYEHIPNYYGEFTLIHNNIVYRYIIKEK